jgi:hypothetical protein
MSVYLLVAFDWVSITSSSSYTVHVISCRLRFFGFSMRISGAIVVVVMIIIAYQEDVMPY